MDCVMGAKFESNRKSLPEVETKFPVKLSISPTYPLLFHPENKQVTSLARIQNPSSLPECRQFLYLEL